MVYLPPSPPPALAPMTWADYQGADCEKGSRDCFPQDRVGGWQIEAVIPLHAPMANSLSPVQARPAPYTTPGDEAIA